MRALAVLALLVAGCPKPPDPNAAAKAELDALLSPSPEDAWAPHAVAVVSEEALEGVIGRSVEARLAAGMGDTGLVTPFGISVRMQTALKEPVVEVAGAEACGRCVAMEVGLVGHTDLSVISVDRQDDYDMEWRVVAQGGLELDIVHSAEEGRIIVAGPQSGNEWPVSVEVSGVPSPFDAMAGSMLKSQMTRQLAATPLGMSMVLGPAKDDGMVALRDIRARGGQGLQVDIAFVALRSGLVGEVPDPGEGWAGVLPRETLLGIVDALLVRQESRRGYAARAVELAFEDGGMVLTLRVVKATKNGEKWRDYKVPLAVGLEGDAIGFEPGEVELVGEEGRWGWPVKGIVTKQVRKQLAAAEVTVPARFEEQIEGMPVALVVDSVEIETERIVIRGRIE